MPAPNARDNQEVQKEHNGHDTDVSRRDTIIANDNRNNNGFQLGQNTGPFSGVQGYNAHQYHNTGHRFQTNNGNGPFFAGPQTGYYTSSPVAEEEAGSPDTAAHQDSGRAVSRNQANALSPSNSNLEDTETTAGAYPLAMARNEPASPRRRAGANGTKKTLGRAPSDPHGTQGNGTSR
ncbi:hypothetical protein HGRIS_005495 [Hohenbuehelia grisea]|uniref:Uncharacterized protein n=1 Tax=Hohenbuehelia grisea TaxID=104357 RepID=A0ABR3JX64_9AGAR